MRTRALPTLSVLALVVVMTGTAFATRIAGDPEQGGPGTPGVQSAGNIQHVANIAYPFGTDEEFATFTVTKLSNGATGDPVCKQNPDGTCVLDANGNPLYETEQRDFAFVGSETVNGYVIDITDPANPVTVASLPCKMSQNDIQIWGTILLQSQDSTAGRCTTAAGGTAS